MVTEATEADLVTVTWGPASAVSVVESDPVTGLPCWSLASTVTVFGMEPASMSAWVTT